METKNDEKETNFVPLALESFWSFLLLIGLALIFNNQIKNFLIKHNREMLTQFPRSLEPMWKKNMGGRTLLLILMPLNRPAQKQFLKAQLSNSTLPVIGGVAIPSVAINLPIFKGLSNEALLYGAGTLSPTQKMGEGNYALASHRAQCRQTFCSHL